MRRQIGEPPVRLREPPPHPRQGHAEVEEVAELRHRPAAVRRVVDEEGDVAGGVIWTVHLSEGDEVGVDGARVLGGARLLPCEGLACGEC